MKKVEKSVNEVMKWMNNVVNAQATWNLDQDPVVRAHEIKTKIKELNNVCEPVVAHPNQKSDHLNWKELQMAQILIKRKKI